MGATGERVEGGVQGLWAVRVLRAFRVWEDRNERREPGA